MQRLNTSFFDVDIAANIGVIPAIVLNVIIYHLKNRRAQKYSSKHNTVYIKFFPELILEREHYLTKEQLLDAVELLIQRDIVVNIRENAPKDTIMWLAITREDLVERYGIPTKTPVEVGYNETR